MSNIQKVENTRQIVLQSQSEFEKLAMIHGAVNFQKEASFALASLADSEYLTKAAMSNPDALKRAIINVAAVGLTLSPVYKYAYLIPRKGKIILDISYKGLIQLAINTGHIKLVYAELVCKNDVFKLMGIGREPIHEFEPFGDRGEKVGVYCLATTKDGNYITSFMTLAEVYKIRDTSESWKSGGQSPWKTFEDEMIKKTIIRRAYKMWPLPHESVFEQAINVINEQDPVEFVDVTPKKDRTEDLKFIRESLVTLEREEAKYVSHLCTVYSRDIKSLEELIDNEVDKELISIKQYLKMKKDKDEKSAANPEPTK